MDCPTGPSLTDGFSNVLTAISISEPKAIAFDTGGTVLDWHTGIRERAAASAAHGMASAEGLGLLANEHRRLTMKGIVGQVQPGSTWTTSIWACFEDICKADDLPMFSREDRRFIARAWHRLTAWSDFLARSTNSDASSGRLVHHAAAGAGGRRFPTQTVLPGTR